jgi:hypothetical protein
LARLRLGRKGVSEVYATVILTSVTMSMIVAAVFFAQLNLVAQSEATEFENGKASMVSLAQMIESLRTDKGAAAYTRFSINSGGLALTPGTESIRLKVEDDEKTVVWDLGTVNLIRLRGGGGVSGSFFQVLQGDKSIDAKDDLLDRYVMIRPNNPGPMGVVYQEWDRGAWVVVDFGRIRVVPSGTSPCTDNGLIWYRVNNVHITYFKIVWGEFSGSDTFDVCVRVKDVKTYPPEKFYSSEVTVSVERGTASNPMHYSDSYSVSSSNVAATLVYLTVVEVEVSVR